MKCRRYVNCRHPAQAPRANIRARDGARREISCFTKLPITKHLIPRKPTWELSYGELKIEPSMNQEIIAHLQSKGLHPTQAWIDNFLSSQKSTVPLPALKQTAFFRLANTDITSTLQNSPGSSFPPDILNAEIRQREIRGPIVAQVLDVEDIGHSRWSQVEAIESEEKGERTKGKEIVRVSVGDEDESEHKKSAGPHKLLLQDSQGTCVYGFELSSVDGVGIGMNIGTKIILRDVTVARSTVLLEQKSVIVLGGKIEDLHRKWMDGRKAALKAAASGSGG